MYKLFKKPLLYLAEVSIGLGILSGVYASESKENLGKLVGNTGTQIARGVFGLIGLDVVNDKFDIFTIGRAANDLVGKDLEYIAGTINGEKTADLKDQGFIDSTFDDLGIAGDIERGVITGAGVGGLVGALRSARYGSVLGHHLNPIAAGAIYGSGAGAIKNFAEETMKGGR